MPQARRIMISLPESLLAQVDTLVREEGTSRSELIREAMRMYIHEQRKRELRERLRQGYETMGPLNLLLAEDALESDEECLGVYESALGERFRLG